MTQQYADFISHQIKEGGMKRVAMGDPQMTFKKRIDVEKPDLDPVKQSELKGKHGDRKDQDIDNDGDVDKSDQYLHRRRQKVSKEIDKKSRRSKAVSSVIKAMEAAFYDTEDELDESMSVHLKAHPNGTHYIVHKVGSKLRSHGGIKVGEKISDTAVDDLGDAGIKVKHIGEQFREDDYVNEAPLPGEKISGGTWYGRRKNVSGTKKESDLIDREMDTARDKRTQAWKNDPDNQGTNIQDIKRKPPNQATRWLRSPDTKKPTPSQKPKRPPVDAGDNVKISNEERHEDDYTGKAGKAMKARMSANKKSGALDDFTGKAGERMKARMAANKKSGALDDFTGEAGKAMKARMAANRQKATAAGHVKQDGSADTRAHFKSIADKEDKGTAAATAKYWKDNPKGKWEKTGNVKSLTMPPRQHSPDAIAAQNKRLKAMGAERTQAWKDKTDKEGFKTIDTGPSKVKKTVLNTEDITATQKYANFISGQIEAAGPSNSSRVMVKES